LGPVWVPLGGASPMGPAWPQWGRDQSPDLLWLPWVRVLSYGPRLSALQAWPVPLAAYGRSGGVARLVGPLFRLPFGQFCPFGHVKRHTQVWAVLQLGIPQPTCYCLAIRTVSNMFICTLRTA